ncbi:GGDEF domain-containing protein [Lacticaseibacillus hulanensis]|jgi:diguanylate cyclase (GGDEF)-like protein|uniref:GGDEF domain-containing protein n=1 Tax=Lacticaseibacillus hulanensis TaxID=2493111 RepID=UPI0013E34A6F|nr:GGDEF domain-containing protein [Lacticaseibacillus hulanensis]
MVIWGLRITTFITNQAVLVAFGVLFTWLRETPHINNPWILKNRQWIEIAALWFVLIIFHFASVWGRSEALTPVGYGWNYLNFQATAIVYALLGDGRSRPMFWSTTALLTLWYHFLAGVPISEWPPLAAITIITMAFGNYFYEPISRHAYFYLPFTGVFVAPLMFANYHSVGNIVVGWPWQIGTLALTVIIMGSIHNLLVNRRARELRLRKEGQVDDLTKLNNFRMFDADLHDAFIRMAAAQKHISLFTFDIDHFKRINDKYGHLVGNAVLTAVSARLNELVETTGYPAKTYRTGGEEFSIIVFGVDDDLNRAARFARMLKTEMAKLHFTTNDGAEFGITISLGQDHTLDDDQNYLDVYNRADKHLYNSKNHGRNTITLCGQLIN